MAESQVVEYSVESNHYSRTIRHELLFSVAKRRFIKPAFSRKSEGKLYYKLMPGNYLKFSLYANTHKNYAYFKIVMVNIDSNGNIDYKDIFETETTYDDILNVMSDINAPYVLAEFVRMLPKYHNVAVVDVDERYQTAETVQEIIESIRKYFESKGVSQ
jgi:hypothetical protein